MQPTSNTTRKLADIKNGERTIFLSVQAGKRITSQLTSLGFTPGVEIKMMQNYGHGPLVVTVRGTRVALGRKEAESMMVQ